jgi:hypothetical protein
MGARSSGGAADFAKPDESRRTSPRPVRKEVQARCAVIRSIPRGGWYA